jgi:hypothetical protein
MGRCEPDIGHTIAVLDGPGERIVDDRNKSHANCLRIAPGIDNHLFQPAHLLRMFLAVPEADMNLTPALTGSGENV